MTNVLKLQHTDAAWGRVFNQVIGGTWATVVGGVAAFALRDFFEVNASEDGVPGWTCSRVPFIFPVQTQLASLAQLRLKKSSKSNFPAGVDNVRLIQADYGANEALDAVNYKTIYDVGKGTAGDLGYLTDELANDLFGVFDLTDVWNAAVVAGDPLHLAVSIGEWDYEQWPTAAGSDPTEATVHRMKFIAPTADEEDVSNGEPHILWTPASGAKIIGDSTVF